MAVQTPRLGVQAGGLNFNIYFVLITPAASLIYKQPAVTDAASDVCLSHFLANFQSSWHPSAF